MPEVKAPVLVEREAVEALVSEYLESYSGTIDTGRIHRGGVAAAILSRVRALPAAAAPEGEPRNLDLGILAMLEKILASAAPEGGAIEAEYVAAAVALAEARWRLFNYGDPESLHDAALQADYDDAVDRFTAAKAARLAAKGRG